MWRLSEPPRKKPRIPRRGIRHPAARHEEIRSGVDASAAAYQSGYEIRLYGQPFMIRMQAPTYQAAKDVRDDQLKTGRFSHAWIEMLPCKPRRAPKE